MRNRRQVEALAHDPMGFSAYETALRQTLKIDDPVDLEAEEKKWVTRLAACRLPELQMRYYKGAQPRPGAGQRLQLWLDQNQSSASPDLSGLMALFATSAGARLKRMTDKQVDKYDPDCGRLQNQVTDRLQFILRQNLQNAVSSSACLLPVSV